MREFQLDQRVSIRNFSDNRKWVTGVVQSRIGPLTYLVKLQDGRLCKRHVDQIIECDVKNSSPSSIETDYVYLPCVVLKIIILQALDNKPVQHQELYPSDIGDHLIDLICDITVLGERCVVYLHCINSPTYCRVSCC